MLGAEAPVGVADEPARLIRLKRKRTAASDDVIVVEAMETTSGLTDHFGGVGIHDSQQRQRHDGSKRFRFVRLSNVNAGDLSSLTREGLAELLTSERTALAAAAAASRCNPVGGTREEASEAGPLPSFPPTNPALQPGLEPWYQQTNTLQGATPAWATVLDLVRHEAGPGAWDPSAQVPHEDPVDEDGYVMDVYAALPAAAEDEQEETDAAWEAHLAGRAPVVQIMDDGTWLVHQSSDRDDTSQDSQDSNAEGHFAHDYPDEYSASTDSGDYDPDLGYFPPTRHRRRHMGSSSGSSSDEDACRTGLRSKDDGRRHFY